MLLTLFVLGAAIVAWHWAHTPWTFRTAELSGSSSALAAADSGEVAYWPALGVLLMASGGLLGNAVLAGPISRKLARAAIWILVVLAGAHILETWLADRLAASEGPHSETGLALVLQAAAFFGFALLPTTSFVAGVGALTAVIRLTTSLGQGSKKRPVREKWDGPSRRGVDTGNWEEGYRLPSWREVSPGSLGICLSGGGIRSATFALGALQALQKQSALDGREEKSEFTRARYLAAVSGGAYTAGGFLLAQKQPTGPPLGLDDLFQPGSVEFDHLRKHSSYIADGLREWVNAALVALRGALIATLSLALVAHVAGRWVGHLYNRIGRVADLDDPWQPVWGAVFAVIAIAALSALLWFWSLARIGSTAWRRWLGEGAFASAVACTVLVVLGAGVPIVVWISAHLVDQWGGAGNLLLLGAAKGGALGSIGVAVTAVGLLSRQRQRILKAVRSGPGGPLRRLGDFGRSALQGLAVVSGLLLVLTVYLIIFGYTAESVAHVKPGKHPQIDWGTPHWNSPVSHFGLTVILTVAMIVMYIVIDETATGLHSFYRRRLASAFAVQRRTRSDGRPTKEGGTQGEEFNSTKAVPYEWDDPTPLHEYGTASDDQGPQVIFCASAHCSDPERTPPGRHVLSFTFSSDAVGGPEMNWCSPNDLRCGPRELSKRLQIDFTVQTAMAASGAAFASASGSSALPANILLSLLNARLGVWVPTPERVGRDNNPQWWEPRPPRRRRMSYLVREIFGWYPRELPLVFVSDGGHYESLGLVELLRHRCGEIYCFDASSDTKAFAATLGQAITLAYDELGVTIELDLPDEAESAGAVSESAGSEGAQKPRTAGSLEESVVTRLADSPVITARITYPPLVDCPREAILVVGRAMLCKEVPWEVLRHAASHPLFPQDATGDQWFDDDKFNAYSTLGRYVGERAIDAMNTARGSAPGSVHTWG